MRNLCGIFRLPKWAKISLVALSGVAIALLVAVFALQSWADNQVESANLTFSKVDKAKSADLDNEYAYEARVHFQRLEFLLRSKSISKINIEKIVWSGIDLSAIRSIETHNRRLSFITTQQLNLDLGANLGIMSYKMDFAPFSKAIVKYSLALIFIFLGAMLLYRFINLYESGSISLSFGQILLPQAIWNGYKSINPLYRHTFWIVFIACSIVFGFHTIHFLWGNHDWGAVFNGYGMFAEKYTGRYTQNIISMFLQDERLLPILNNLLAFGGIALASVLLCAYFNLPKKLYIWVIVGLVMTLQPFTLTRMYYAFQVAGLFIAVAIGILGFVLAKKAGEYRANAKLGGGGERPLF